MERGLEGSLMRSPNAIFFQPREEETSLWSSIFLTGEVEGKVQTPSLLCPLTGPKGMA